MAQYDRKDHFYHKAKKEGYPARSAYKLLELDKRFKILKAGTKIVDLGCAPGGWLKVIEEKLLKSATSETQTVIGIDLLPLQFTPKKGILFIQGNFLEEENQQKIISTLGGKAEWILSDMSPNLSGVKFRDLEASLELCRAAFTFSQKILKGGGGLIVKIFPGPESALFQKELKKSFKKISTVVPESTRSTSNEVYLVAEGFVS
jgi:23S rRNA (uridine2552-2'-O)-methyltransferase